MSLRGPKSIILLLCFDEKSFKNLSLNESNIKSYNALLTFTNHEAFVVEIPQIKNVQRNYPSPF